MLWQNQTGIVNLDTNAEEIITLHTHYGQKLLLSVQILKELLLFTHVMAKSDKSHDFK